MQSSSHSPISIYPNPNVYMLLFWLRLVEPISSFVRSLASNMMIRKHCLSKKAIFTLEA